MASPHVQGWTDRRDRSLGVDEREVAPAIGVDVVDVEAEARVEREGQLLRGALDGEDGQVVADGGEVGSLDIARRFRAASR